MGVTLWVIRKGLCCFTGWSSLFYFLTSTTPKTFSTKNMTTRNIVTFNPYLSNTVNIDVNLSVLLWQKGWATRRLREMWLSYIRYVDGTDWEIPPDLRICMTWYLNLRLNPFLWSDSYLRRFFTDLARRKPLDFCEDHPDITRSDVFNTVRTAEMLLSLSHS